MEEKIKKTSELEKIEEARMEVVLNLSDAEVYLKHLKKIHLRTIFWFLCFLMGTIICFYVAFGPYWSLDTQNDAPSIISYAASFLSVVMAMATTLFFTRLVFVSKNLEKLTLIKDRALNLLQNLDPNVADSELDYADRKS